MALLTKLTSRAAVERAMSEFDALGRTAFLEKYGFGRAQDYFIDHNGRYYDSKAITGVAYGIENPQEGPLTPDAFSGGKSTVQVAMRRLGFNLVPDPYRFLILVENEVHARPEFAKWKDLTGERYHFPNIYRNKVIPGREFIYYKGGRRKEGGRATPEYFGWGRIGSVYPDPTTTDLPASKWQWLCEIEEYREFTSPVAFRDAGNRYLELGTAEVPTRYWEAGVRLITERSYHAILSAAQISIPSESGTEGADVASVTEVVEFLGLLIQPKNGKPGGQAGSHANYAGRKSGRAKIVGDTGERLVLEWLRKSISDEAEKEKIVWVATEGLTPGWDIEDRRRASAPIAYEVKSTNGEKVPAIEITANEWGAAERLRERYNLVIVAECEGRQPKLQVINDPWGLLMDGKLSLLPTMYRLART